MRSPHCRVLRIAAFTDTERCSKNFSLFFGRSAKFSIQYAQSILQRNGLDTVRIVNPRPMTMEQFTSKRQPQEKCSFRKCPIEQSNTTHCTRANVVYEARCGLCPATYIGATTRAFHTRAREHLGNITRREIEKSALAEHFVKHHDAAVDNPIVTFRTLATAKNELCLWIQEAYWIQRLKIIPQQER